MPAKQHGKPDTLQEGRQSMNRDKCPTLHGRNITCFIIISCYAIENNYFLQCMNLNNLTGVLQGDGGEQPRENSASYTIYIYRDPLA